MKKSLLLTPLLLAALAACGTGYGSASSPGAGAASGTSTVRVGSSALGKVLVDGRGHTVYLLSADSPGHSTCGADCLVYWTPLSASGTVPHRFPGVTAKVASTSLPDGGRTLTADGWPLYTFVKDQAPGDVTGQGLATFGGVWYALSPSGQRITATPPSGSPSTSPSSGGSSGTSTSRGYSY